MQLSCSYYLSPLPSSPFRCFCFALRTVQSLKFSLYLTRNVYLYACNVWFGICSPLSKTVRFNVLKVDTTSGAGKKQFQGL